MEQTFLTELKINKVRHLENISIPLSQTERKNLVLTGKNGSGKTSVLKSLVVFLEYVVSGQYKDQSQLHGYVKVYTEQFKKANDSEIGRSKREEVKQLLSYWNKNLKHWTDGCTAECPSFYAIREKYQAGRFVLAYYGDHRKINVAQYKNIEKVDLKPVYGISESPSQNLGKYLVNLKST